MSVDRPNQISNSLDEPSSSIQNEVKPTEDMGEPDQSFQSPGLTAEKKSADLNYEPRDPTADQAPLNKHLHSIVKGSPEYSLPPVSSRSSVVWKDLMVRGGGARVTYQQTIGQILRSPVTAIENLTLHGKTPERVILHGVEGVVREGEMLLILGRPGSGCTTLLKILCGLTNEYLGWQGDIRYNGVGVETFKTLFRGDAVYTPEGKSFLYSRPEDVHFPHLNVSDTLNFVAETKTPRLRAEGESKKDYVMARTDLLATSFGLRHTLKTKVGNEYVRGISGGERRRVSLAETLATRASVTYWDNPTKGLDASTSLDFIRLLRGLTTITNNTAIVALYQAGENLIREFDKVTVLYLGRQVFFGTVADAKAYFEDLGFRCSPRQTTADFLTAITDPHARQAKEGWEARTPRTPEDFVNAWKKSSYYSQLSTEIQQYDQDFAQTQSQLEEYERYQLTQRAEHQRNKSVYMVSLRAQLVANLKRAFHRMVGDKVFLGAMAFSATFLSLIIGSMFYNLQNTTSAFYSKSGALFFSVLFNAVQTLSEIGTQYAQRPIVQRQKTYAMYHPFADAVASMAMLYPYKLAVVTIFDLVIYFMANLKREAGAFFIFWLTTYLAAVAMSGYFRSIASVTRKPETAMGLAGVSVLAFAVYTGYVIPKPSMHPWFKWITYIDPLSYAFEILMANEFHGVMAVCTTLVPSGPGFKHASPSHQACAVTGAKPGQTFVSGDDYIEASFGYYHSHVGRNIGILCAFICGFISLFALATEFKSFAMNQGDSLVFRRGHEPENIRKVLRDGKIPDDVESQEDYGVLTEVKTNVSEMRRLVQSKDIITWEHLSYDIATHEGETRRLLSDISGYVKPGTLTALMGESGAGKTTLLNVLAQRADVGVFRGQVSVNGSPPGRSFRRQTGYVQQQDVHFSESTVREALRFSAVLRQPNDVSIEEKYAYVENVIEILEMQAYAEAIIGVPGSGLNLEQRKRTTIGVELVAKPALLFLDEPTSGLDSQSAWSIVRLMRKLANAGQAILCTIHQPSSVLFQEFDRLLLLAKGGKTVFFGDVGDQARQVINYFESNGAFLCPADANPAEYILDVVGAGASAHVDHDWNEIWTQSKEHHETLTGIRALNDGCTAGVTDKQTHASVETEFAVPWLSQYRAVQKRLYLHYWRNPTYVGSKFFLNVVAGLFIGFTFYKEGDSVQGLQNKVFATFMGLILAMPLMNQFQSRFAALAQVYLVREKQSEMYHWSTFVLSLFLVEIPYNIVAGSLFFISWFNAVNFYHSWPTTTNQGARGFSMWLIFMFFQMWVATFGQAIGCLAPNPETASSLTTVFAAFVLLFSGVFQPLSQLISFWHWVYRASPYTYLVSGLISTALHGVPVNCTPKEIIHFSPPSGQTCGGYAGTFANATGNLLNPEASENCMYCRYRNGDEYLAYLSMNYSDRWRNTGLLAVYVLFNMALAFLFFYLTKVAPRNFARLGLLKRRKGKM